MSPNTGMTIGNMLLFALLSGGDYGGGLIGVGPATVQGVSEYNLGNDLLDAAKNRSRYGLTKYLREWREDLITALLDDPLGMLPANRHPIVIPNDFPSVEIVLQYVKPLTSWSQDGSAPFGRDSLLIIQPNLARLAVLCNRNFGWKSDEIITRFCRKLWGPCLARLLYGDIFNGSPVQSDEIFVRSLLAVIVLSVILTMPPGSTRIYQGSPDYYRWCLPIPPHHILP